MKKPTDLDTLKAWCHWKKLETGVCEDDLLMVKAIEDVISQVGTWKAKAERAESTLAVSQLNHNQIFDAWKRSFRALEAAKSVVSNWNEFGPDGGISEWMDHLEIALAELSPNDIQEPE